MLTKKDLQLIKALYPKLEYSIKEEKEYLIGTLDFKACWNCNSKEFIINPTKNIIVADTYVEDNFHIEVEFLNFPKQLPIVREIGGRVQQIINKYSLKDIRDLHINKGQNNAACLCPKPVECLIFPKNVDIGVFFSNLVIPFFYGLSYYEKFRKWPWDEYSHGELGVLESYNEFMTVGNQQFLLNTFNTLGPEFQRFVVDDTFPVNRQTLCPVCKNEKFRKCHHEAWLGLKRLKADYHDSL